MPCSSSDLGHILSWEYDHAGRDIYTLELS